jgi:hypothetical protein
MREPNGLAQQRNLSSHGTKMRMSTSKAFNYAYMRKPEASLKHEQIQ